MREPGVKQKGAQKTSRIPVKTVPRTPLVKPAWIRVRAASPNSRFYEIKDILRAQKLHTVCEEASCPNVAECFGKGTATFMILGDICTRRCPFCDVAHGRPLAPDGEEPAHLAETIARLKLAYVVVTSVDRDDLRDGGAQHFVDCIRAVRARSPRTTIEALVPDFRGRLERALAVLHAAPPDVMNHNLETVPRLYHKARPGGDYAHSLRLLKTFKESQPSLPTKSGLMVGLGETDDEILQVMRDLRAHEVEMLTIGQYLAPSVHHLPVERYVAPEAFARFEREAAALGFRHAAIGPLVRSSYHADQQAHAAGVDRARCECSAPAAHGIGSMSDIGFQGLVTAMVSLGMLAIALIGFVVEGVLLWKRRGTSRAAARTLLGPAIYAIAAIVLAAVAELGSLAARGVFDNWSWLLATVAAVPWIGLHWRRGNQPAGDLP